LSPQTAYTCIANIYILDYLSTFGQRKEALITSKL